MSEPQQPLVASAQALSVQVAVAAVVAAAAVAAAAVLQLVVGVSQVAFPWPAQNACPGEQRSRVQGLRGGSCATNR